MSFHLLKALAEKRPEVLSLAEYVILFQLASFADARTNEAWPSLSTLAASSGMERGNVGKLLKRLQQHGVVELVEGSKGRGSRYRITLETVVVTTTTVVLDTTPNCGSGNPDCGSHNHNCGSDNHSTVVPTTTNHTIEQITEHTKNKPTCASEAQAAEEIDLFADPAPLEKSKSKPPPPPPAIVARFQRFWDAWPKRGNVRVRATALASFARHSPDDTVTDQMIAAVKHFDRTPQWQDDNGRYIPHAATWLNQRRWEDVAEVAAAEAGRPRQKTTEEVFAESALEFRNRLIESDEPLKLRRGAPVPDWYVAGCERIGKPVRTQELTGA